ncbi:hypothetical protein SAMN05444164_1683 [Bradyrhizobium erythrophlei]|uniref:Uncharacterized protein n=1 Tax=Bradyrhizobium erythrophlei TaxID=1437360 RepID=A0A1H4S031_9BRAD|nr:hypothetical protein SAMN05444164_1683 [Bradyrhizobium erythrophlei]
MFCPIRFLIRIKEFYPAERTGKRRKDHVSMDT